MTDILPSRVYAKINLDAIVHNLKAIHSLLKPDTQVIAVVKTDGYGHGANEVAKVLQDIPYVFGFAVATAPEAFALRACGVQKPILVLGCVFEEHDKLLVEQEIRPAVFTIETARRLSLAAQEAGKDLAVHIKLDTGMGRIGMPADEESVKTIAQISALPHIIIEGIFTHFANADETDKSMANRQLEQFLQVRRNLEAAEVAIPYYHCSNSAGIIDLPQADTGLVRAGIILYGMLPSEEVQKGRIRLRPAMELKSTIAYIKSLPAGRSISYGCTYTTKQPERIATIPVGYGDGYPRSLSNKGYVLIRGKRAPIRGRICMDQFMVDVTDIADAKIGDPVTLAGTDGPACITLEELGELSGRFHYEFACGISKRVPRIYDKGGVWLTEK